MVSPVAAQFRLPGGMRVARSSSESRLQPVNTVATAKATVAQTSPDKSGLYRGFPNPRAAVDPERRLLENLLRGFAGPLSKSQRASLAIPSPFGRGSG